ncbi:hypothetical protein PACTADRAFT_47922 [Pachysolen tannophilus NRRL Y-2460]|uniref:Single-stranded DNA-binding protein n=1 Tax=Pachysolen tannophilus NRRL Y-2460 TaxID=669874 RepID=A0A1E4U283_PACTA|nr:hypothetical protein PACTADRAFT_47922 [Pachysolen tannophilus NRRL Y-2460]
MTMIGTIGTDLVEQTTSTGKNYLKYSIAINGKTKGVQTTSWFNIAVFSPTQVEFMQKYLGKGAKVYVEADASNTSFEKEDGSKSYSLMLFQNNIEAIKFPKAKEEETQTA